MRTKTKEIIRWIAIGIGVTALVMLALKRLGAI